MLGFGPGAELFEGEIVDGIDLVDEHLFDAGQFEVPVAALHARRVFAGASSSGAHSQHVGMTHAKANRDFSDTVLGPQYAVTSILPIGLTKMPCHDSPRFTVSEGLTSKSPFENYSFSNRRLRSKLPIAI
jgi:hypothetical protein